MPAMAADLITLGQRIKSEREAQGMTQRELAERAQFEQSRLSKLEAGKTDPGLAVLESLALALGKTLPWLVEDQQETQLEGVSADALALARQWQALPKADREAVRRIVQGLSKRDAE
jgi:transcriptional regulator with XRE-family HTH domain